MFHVKHSSPHVLLINPWITDFAAYNFWIKPLGLLSIGSSLRRNGFRISFIDCLDFLVKRRPYGDGKFRKIRIDKPGPLMNIPRYYSQYGICESEFLEKLEYIDKPDLIAVTSGMTYWYPGVFKLIEFIKNLFKDVPLVLGGIYATLCYDHAQEYSGADHIFKGRDEQEAQKLISELTGFETGSSDIRNLQSPIRNRVYPAFDLYPDLDYVCISTSRGCPFRCLYCATSFLSGGFVRTDPIDVVKEIEYWTTQHGVRNYAFYDDALLVKPEDFIVPMLKETIKRGISIKFHAPNGLHMGEIDGEVAGLMFKGGFKTIRFGFETSDEATQVETGGKIDNKGFERAVNHLKRAGYSGKEIGVYVLVGMPGQKVGEVKESIAYVKGNGVRPILTEYSPIPHTPLFEKAKQLSRFDIEKEPLYQNNSIFPCQWEGFTQDDMRRLKVDLQER